ncbi:restriction endonuclease subunit S [Vibrio cyclitrophicus]
MTSSSTGFVNMELGACLELVIDHRGKTPRKLKSDWVESGIPTISAKNVNSGKLVATGAIRYVTHDVYKKWMSVDVARGDCFLVSEGATLGHCMYWDETYPIVLGQRIFCLRANPEILYSRYLYAYMNTIAFQSEIVGRATGSSVSGLRQTEVLKLNIKVPPMAVQKIIGDTLYNLNKKAEVNNQTNQTLEEMSQAIFRSWFVDFAPVKAKMNGEHPEGMDEATASLFPEKLVESELGLIPEGWEPKQLKDVLELAYGKALKKTVRVAGDVPVYGSGGLTGYHNQSLVEGPGIIIGRKGTVGSVYWEPKAFYPIDTVFYVKPKTGYSLKYCHLVLQNLGLKNMNTDAAVPGLNRNNAYRLDVITPSESVLKKFEEMMQSFQSKVDANNAQNASLESLRDTLLPKLLSGEVEL